MKDRTPLTHWQTLNANNIPPARGSSAALLCFFCSQILISARMARTTATRRPRVPTSQACMTVNVPVVIMEMGRKEIVQVNYKLKGQPELCLFSFCSHSHLRQICCRVSVIAKNFQVACLSGVVSPSNMGHSCLAFKKKSAECFHTPLLPSVHLSSFFFCSLLVGRCSRACVSAWQHANALLARPPAE